ncbi:MAG TPA: PTS sugar transporter subunit IIA [Rhabdochlamydiaceae bacterium]|nr:PTS sugar transporter subunit IIA [Rhabdochlamydiaceae bacterium]
MAILARINHQIATGISDLRKFFKKGEIVAISNYLDDRLVSFLNVDNRNAVLEELVNVLDVAGKLLDKQSFYKAILEREKIVSTGIGMGVAIPHAKLEGYEDFFIAIGIQKKGIEWNALDGQPVKVIFMIGGPENKQTEYLKILSHLTIAIKDEERRKKLLKATASDEVIALFEGC